MESRYSMVFTLLGTRFQLFTSEDDLLSFSRAFTDCYRSCSEKIRWRWNRELVVTVRRGCLPPPSRLPAIPVHRYGRNDHWNIDAELYPARTIIGIWRSKGIMVKIDTCWTNVEIIVDNSTDTQVASEAVFHMCRGLAVYLRVGADGNLLHASGVELDGRAILFSGSKMAGKSTLLLEAVSKYGATPLTNDRIYISANELPIATSWPSYVTLCEGTILNYPALASAALAYEQGAYPFRGQSWPEPLEPVFASNKKRLYPMAWLSDALSTKYIWSSPLGAIVFARLTSEVEIAQLDEINFDDMEEGAQIKDTLEREGFDQQESAFRPWHGRPLPVGMPAIRDLMSRMKQSGVKFYRLILNPTKLSPLGEMLEEIKSRFSHQAEENTLS